MDTDFQKEIEAAMEPQLKEMRTIRDEITEAQTKLNSEREKGANPDDSHVLDLEETKIELENRIEEQRREMRDLKMKLEEHTPSTESKPGDLFRGVFLKDADALRELKRDKGIEAVQRALTSGTTLSSEGALNAEQEDQFLDWMVEQQAALSRVQVRRMSASQAQLDELVTATRKLVKATEATAPSAADAFSTARRSLTTVETIWGEDLSYSFIEDNIERGGIESHIARNMAMGFGNDHNDLFWNGDEDDSDAFLSINDGIIDIAKADGSVTDYNATSVTSWTSVLNGMLKALDFKYQALPDKAYWIPFSGTFVYADELSDRATSLGDQVLVNGLGALRYFGVPVIGDNHLASDEAVLTPMRNLIWGVQRGITFEQERKPRKRVIEYTITARTDQNYSKSEAVVLADSLESSLT